MKKSLIAVAVISSLFVGSAFAATSGTLGETSAGGTSLGQVIANMVKVTGLSDPTFTRITSDVNGDVTVSQSYCVHSNRFGHGYTVKMTNAAGSYKLTHSTQAGNQLTYSVEVAGNSAGTGATGLAHDVQSGAFTGSASKTCSGGANAFIRFTIPAAEFNEALAGTYSGLHTLTVTPEAAGS